MEILKKIKIEKDQSTAFSFFIDEFNSWWPQEYTWSGKKLKSIHIDGKIDGLCTELGPHDFRIDWGRVVTFEPPQFVHIKWQITPDRLPEPDPEKASDIEITFEKDGNQTAITLIHRNFQNHGEGGAGYRNAMDSEQGWYYILNLYKSSIEKS